MGEILWTRSNKYSSSLLFTNSCHWLSVLH